MNSKRNIIIIIIILLILGALSVIIVINAENNIGNESDTNSSENVCIADVFQCEDGSYVSRDPDRNCEFRPCS